jgi:hypothetical protein
VVGPIPAEKRAAKAGRIWKRIILAKHTRFIIAQAGPGDKGLPRGLNVFPWISYQRWSRSCRREVPGMVPEIQKFG